MEIQKSNLNFKIRDAVKEDMESVHNIFNGVLIHWTATFEEEPHTRQVWNEIFDFKQAHKLPFIVVELAGKIIGYGTFCSFQKASGYKITVERSLHVDNEFRGYSIGKTLLEELIKRTTLIKIENMIAGVDAENLSSMFLHEKFGFRKVGRMENVARK